MFGILKRWRERRLRRKREIYSYFDGHRFRVLDPWRCHRAYLEHELFDSIDFDAAGEGEEPHCTNLITMVCDSFGLSRLDPETGVGMTDNEVLEFLIGFNNYMQGVKKKHSHGAISLSVSESEFSPPAVPPASTTSSRLDSGSYSPAPETVVPRTY